jgi:hypothetical protein
MPVQPVIVKRLLDDSVLINSHNVIERHVHAGNYDFVTNVNTPWFESYRDVFIKTGHVGDHEFLKHFLSCIFVVSTGHIDPLDRFQKLVSEHQQTVQQQQQQQQQSQAQRFPKWFFPNIGNIYRYFVLLHDVSDGEISKAHQIYENLKNTYGSSNCHLLQINSKPSTLNSVTTTTTTNQIEYDPSLQYCKFNELMTGNRITDDSNEPLINDHPPTLTTTIQHPLTTTTTSSTSSSNDHQIVLRHHHGQCLAPSDHDRIKTFICEYLQRGLVPYAERTIKIINEQIQSKKSILKSFSIPRRIFGGGSSSSSSSVVVVPPTVNLTGTSESNNNVTIATTTTLSSMTMTTQFVVATNDEFQTRRLADLAFMFRLYDLAYQSYHSCKKDFNSHVISGQSTGEHLLLMNFCVAGALEMTSMANFMQQFAFASSSSSSLSSQSSTIKSRRRCLLILIPAADRRRHASAREHMQIVVFREPFSPPLDRSTPRHLVSPQSSPSICQLSL